VVPDFASVHLEPGGNQADSSLTLQIGHEISLPLGHGHSLPRLYSELADWWPLLSAPQEYAEEAAFYREALVGASAFPPQSLLELGSGGGNNASHLKRHFQMTLVDYSPAMLRVSLALNPECEHIQGDMRTVRLGRTFDAVFVHDAIMYMTSQADLRQAITTAFVHCRPGGAALFATDHVRETFRPSTAYGGHDGPERSLRYLEWTHEPNPGDATYIVDMVYLLRAATGEVGCEHDRHVLGLFGRDDWLRYITEAGFAARVIPFQHSQVESGPYDVFLGVRAS